MLANHSKFPNLGISIFSAMSALAQQYGAINLAQGFPGFEVSEQLVDLVGTYMRKGVNQYSPMEGVLRLREVISQKQKNLYGISYDVATEVTISAGATEAVFAAISAFVHEGDEVICFEPVFDIYPPAIDFNKGKLIRIKLETPHFHYDWDKVAALVNPKTKLIILNTPHNPTGKILTAIDIEKLVAIVKNTSIVVISDEVYEHMVFDGKSHLSLASHPQLYDRTVVIASLGKVFHCTGWRIGYCLAPKYLTAEIRKVHQFVTFSANTPIQYAMADFLEQQENYLSLSKFFQQKRDFFIAQMSGSAFKFLPTDGSYFLLADYSAISQMSDLEFVKWITQKHAVAAIPVSVFNADGQDDKLIRFCFAKKEQELAEAAKRLCVI
ncbi:MAG TPA: methionine aminotransferase [Cytophagales bacterium]|nr:methionine aminotransferase [Cytophagales bacterium]